MRQFYQVHWASIPASALRIALIILVAWLAMRFAKIALRRFEQHMIRRGQATGEIASESYKRAETLVQLLHQAVLIMLWLVSGLVVLRELGVEIAPILASAGIVGLALGFGAQNLVRDVIAGFFMILENQVRVGDVATVNGTSGLVEQINFRTIVLRDAAGTVYVFPNGAITTLANMTREWSAYVLNISVAYKEDPDRIMDIMHRVATELRNDPRFRPLMLDDIEMFGVDKIGDSSIVLHARLRTVPIKQWEVGREYLRRLKFAFDKEGVEIPHPHRAIYFNSSEKSSASLLLTPKRPTAE
ncbi:MAG: mechanosensitive ion channel family protein [Gammaproteobacteria bacterium]|nr:mechanosensitive ion channel family protein [Gammaproteobacteria bacterium]